MKKIFLILFLCIIIPLPVFASSIDDIVGYWVSEKPLPGHNKKGILVITKNSIQHGKRSPVACKFSQADNNIVAIFEGPFKSSIRYEINVNDDKMILDFPTATGNRSQQSYIRINEEKAQLYLK